MTYSIWINQVNNYILYLSFNKYNYKTLQDYINYRQIYNFNNKIHPRIIAFTALSILKLKNDNVKIKNLKYNLWMYKVDKQLLKKYNKCSYDLPDFDFEKLFKVGLNINQALKSFDLFYTRYKM